MGLNTRSARPPIDAPIRWSIRKVTTEFGIAETTLKTGLKRHGISPGEDQRFTTQQIAKAIFDNERYDARLKEAKTRTAEDEAEEVHNRLLLQRGTLLRTETVEACFVEIFTQIAQCIRHLPHLTREHKESALKILHDFRFDSTKEITSPAGSTALNLNLIT